MKSYEAETSPAVRRKLIDKVNYTPIALFGCPLGLLGLTLATLHIETAEGFAHVAGGVLLIITVAIFALILAAYMTKAIRSPESVLSDWEHPVRSNFFAIISGMFALLALAILPFSKDVALPLWVAGAIAHLAVTLGVASKWIGPRIFETSSVTPTMFLPAVGNALFPLAGVSLGFVELSWFFFSVGIILWVILLPILIGRLLTQVAPPDGMLPTLVIFIAPPSLLMMNYQQLDPTGAPVLSRILYYTSLMFFLFVLTQIPRLSRIQFSLSWWAYTFPIGALTVGTLTFANITGIEGFKTFGAALFVVLIYTVLVVLWKTVRALAAGKLFVPEQ